jgi:hypothetical protein
MVPTLHQVHVERLCVFVRVIILILIHSLLPLLKPQLQRHNMADALTTVEKTIV